MRSKPFKHSASCALGSILISGLLAAEPISLIMSDLQYLGAFRITATNQEGGKTGWASNKIAISSDTNSFFLGGSPFSSIAEFQIPEIVKSHNLDDLAFTGPPIQNFSNWASRIGYRTPKNNIRSIGGISLINGKLAISVYDPYDAAKAEGFALDNMVIIDDAADLANSTVTGFFTMESNMYAAGWLSPIPPNLQEKLGGDYITGSARMASINARWSMGPSAYSLYVNDLLNIKEGATVPNTKLQRYGLTKRMDWQLPNSNTWNYEGTNLIPTENCPSFVNDNSAWKAECVLENDIWTEVSRAFYGAIIPGTTTYLTVGRLGGRNKGIAYKNLPINGGHRCSGECPYDWTDWDNYIWLFDVQNLINVKNGIQEEHDAMPYEYGPIKLPFDDLNGNGFISSISSADFDPKTNRLYIVLGNADTVQNRLEAPGIVIVYEIALNRPKAPVWVSK